MGASWSVTLVSRDGEETSVPVDLLSSASTVWCERLKLAGSLSPTPRAEETCTADEIKAFVQVISARTREAEARATDIPVKTLFQALPLVHKYDCKGAKMMMDELDVAHFPDSGVQTKSGAVIYGQGWVISEGTTVHSTAPWLTQDHLDYLVRKQELYQEDAVMTSNMKKLLGKMLTLPLYDGQKSVEHSGSYLRFSDLPSSQLPQISCQRQEPLVIDSEGGNAVESASADSDEQSNLVLKAWRLTSHSFNMIVPLLLPK